jgi:hypothetical protein
MITVAVSAVLAERYPDLVVQRAPEPEGVAEAQRAAIAQGVRREHNG